MRATSALKRDDGISTRGWRAWTALRIRVSMSAIGSVIVTSPTALDNAWNLAAQRQLAEAQAAQRELAHIRARTAALAAPVAMPNRVLRRLVEVLDGFCCRRHFSDPCQASGARRQAPVILEPEA